MTFIKITDDKMRSHWVTPERLAQEQQEGGIAVDILDRIDAALEGYVNWNGRSPDAAVVTFGRKREREQPALFDHRPIGPRQADTLRWIYQHPGCSLSAAIGGSGAFWTYRGVDGLEQRGLVIIDRTDPRQYHLTITPVGIAALRARAHRFGFVTGDPLRVQEGRAS
jgi:hypothetical protein